MGNDIIDALLQMEQALMPLRIIEIMAALFFYDALSSLVGHISRYFAPGEHL